MSELRAAARAALTCDFGFHDDRFALLLLSFKGLGELWQESLKLMQVHSRDSQELFGTSTKFAIEGHRGKLSLSFAYRATGLVIVCIEEHA